MESVQALFDQFVALLREGFGEVNGVKGILIGLAATIFMQSWRQWLPLGLVAVLVHIAIDWITPVLQGGGELRLPNFLEEAFWAQAGVLFVGYLVIIGVFYFIKTLLLKKGGGGAKH
jgi:hypothetical protein